jgi:hypothetical protein
MGGQYQVQLSDTARADLERLEIQSESSPSALEKLRRVRMLLDQLGQDAAAASDREIPSSSPELALQYHSEGDLYLYFRRFEPSKTVIVAFFCEMQVERAAQFAPALGAAEAAEPAPPRILDWQLRDIPHGMEVEGAIEFTRDDGTKRMIRSFVRKVDWGDSYTVCNHFAADAQPARTMIISAQKGEVEGSWRRDTIEMVELHADGSATRHPPQTVPVWIRNPFYEGASTEDMLARIERDAPWKPGFERMKALMNQGLSMGEALAAVREDPDLKREVERRMEALTRTPEPM